MTADELQRLRWQLGLTQIELAQRLGVARSTVAAWEVGVNQIPRRLWATLMELSGNATYGSDNAGSKDTRENARA